MNRRYVLKNRRRFYIFVLAITVSLSCMLFAATANGADTNPEYSIVTVEKGDTLWNLAKEYNHGGDIRSYIREVQKINDLTDGIIYEGDEIKMPV